MKQLTLGDELEKIAHQFLWDRGYLAFNRIKLVETKVKMTGRLDINDVTDLDAFGIYYGPYLEKRTFLIDCKHRNQTVYLQILKSKGISSILSIDNLLVLRSSVPEIVQQFSDRFGVKIASEKAFRNINVRECGSFSKLAFLKTKELSDDIIEALKPLNYSLLGTFLLQDPFIKIKRIVGIYEDTKEFLMKENLWEQDSAPNSINYFVFRIFQQLQLAICDIASNSIHLSFYHLKSNILRKSIGDIQLKIQLFSNLILDGNDEEELDFDEEKEDLWKIAPIFTKDLLDTIKEVIRKPEIVQKYLRYVDFVFHDSFMVNKPLDFSRVEKELGAIPRKLFVKWSTQCLKVLDRERTYPSFLVKLLA